MQARVLRTQSVNLRTALMAPPIAPRACPLHRRTLPHSPCSFLSPRMSLVLGTSSQVVFSLSAKATILPSRGRYTRRIHKQRRGQGIHRDLLPPEPTNF
jgi:hypothetical protein